ncbi:MAG: VCBS repeat-containing protein, partial [Verrucomicrobiota bacterium]
MPDPKALRILAWLFFPAFSLGAADLEKKPLKVRKAIAGPLFSPIPSTESGVTFTNPVDESHPFTRLYATSFACGGIAIGDANQDGKNDLFFTSGPGRNRLFLQTGPFQFVGSELDFGYEHWAAGVTFVDIDSDGDDDLYVCHYDAPNALFINESRPGEPTPVFVEKAKAFGLDLSDASLMPSFCDYDRDGDLDLFILCHAYERETGRPKELPIERENGRYHIRPEFDRYYKIRENPGRRPGFTEAGRANYLYRNDGPDPTGQIRFTDATSASGLTGRGFGNSATWWDSNDDGWLDLYVGNDLRDPDQLFLNSGNGTFTEVIRNTTGHTPWFSMGADAADINNDARMDLLVADMAGRSQASSKATMGDIRRFRSFLLSAEPRQYMRNALFLNTGTSRLIDIAPLAGVARSDWTWAVKFADYDNDGRTDLFLTNGVARSFNDADHAMTPRDRIGQTQWDYWKDFPPRNERNLAFKNEGDLRFSEVSETWGLDLEGMSYSAATGDLDGDGDLDLVVNNLNTESVLYRNQSASGNLLRIQLQSHSPNRRAIGARLTLQTNQGSQTRQL